MAASPHCTTILIVEDDELIRDLFKEVLEGEGFRVLAASSGDEALRLCSGYEETVHLLLADVVLPGTITGIELAKRLRNTREDIQVLLMSGYPREIVSRKGALDPRDGFLWKPFSNRTLLAALRSALVSPPGAVSRSRPRRASTPRSLAPA